MHIVINRNSMIPLHTQLLNQLRHYIFSGQWEPHSRLPSETELQQQLKISRSTIRQALSNAEKEGLIERVPGKGTFVAAFAEQSGNSLIGYITFDFLSDFQRQLLAGAECIARTKGYRILFANSNRDVREEDRLLDQLLLEDKVNGILIWPALHDDPSRRLLQLANQCSSPLVLIDRTFRNVKCDYVTSDNYAGAYAATEHLVQLGHRHIIFLSRPILQLLPISERLRGYQEAMRNAGLTPLEPLLVGTADQEMGTGYALRTFGRGSSQEIQEIARTLESTHRPSAIFAMHDLMAIQVLKAAKLVGLRVPDDLSVVGFDDMEIVTHLEVPLTTVVQDTYKMGKRAAELLMERIQGYQGPPRHEVLPTHLKVRYSTTSPP